jgi:hypothetical protein
MEPTHALFMLVDVSTEEFVVAMNEKAKKLSLF